MIFPTNPTINQIYSENNKNWIWTGISWIDYNPAISQLTILKGLLSGGNASGAGGKLIVDDVASTTNETCNSLIVMNGTANNYIAGSLGIGTNSPRGKLEMSSASSPSFALTDTSQTSNNKTWDFGSNNGQIYFRAVNDNYSTANVWLSASRTGTTITNVSIPNSTLTVGSSITATNGFSVTAGGTCTIALLDTSQTTDTKNWDIMNSGGKLSFRAVNDAYNADQTWLTVTRTGTTINNVTFPFGISTYSSIVQDYGSTNAKLSIRGALGNSDYSPLTQAGDIGFIIDGANAGRTDAGLTFAWWNSTSQGMRLSSAGNLTISGNSLSINTTFTPSASASTGVKGQITWDTGYIYVCTETNTWKRAALSTW